MDWAERVPVAASVRWTMPNLLVYNGKRPPVAEIDRVGGKVHVGAGDSLPRKKPFLLTSKSVMPGTTARKIPKGLTSLLTLAPHASALGRTIAEKLPAAAVFWCWMGLVAAPALWGAAPPDTPAPATGRTMQQTRRTATIHWQRVPLRDALARLRQLFDERVFVDRRVDPNQRITLDVQAASVDDVLGPIAAALSLGVSRLGPLRYLGPQSAAEQLRTVAAVRSEDAARLSAEKRTSLLRRQRLSWPRLTEPRGLITALARQRGWRIDHAQRIPHDLWPAGSLPDVSLVEQLTVLLAGFDLTFRVAPNARTLEIVPLEPTTIKRRYRLPARLSEPAALLQQQLPDLTARVEMEGETLAVDGRIEDHERLAEILRGTSTRERQSPPIRETREVYTLRVEEQPVGAVLRQLAERLTWQLEIDESGIREAGLSLDRRVSFAVENSDQDELLEAVLQPAGLDYRRDGRRLRIVPRETNLP